MLQPPSKARERILLIGLWGGGKSQSWADIHAWLRRTNSNARMFVVDSDFAHDRVCPDLPEDDVRDVYEYQEYVDAVAHFRSQATADDWLVVDHISKAWDATQRYYIEQAFGKNKSTFFLEHKSAGGDGSPLADGYGSNWQVINALYADFMTPVKRWPGHILACAPAEPIKRPNEKTGKGGDDKMVIDAYGRYGIKPGGQKMLGFEFLTVINMIPKSDETFAMTTIKDVKRDRPQNQVVKSFTLNYLCKIAGWTL